MKRIIMVSLLVMTILAILPLPQVEAEGEGGRRQSKTTSANLTKIILQPGDKKQIILDKDESITIEFHLPEPGSCDFRLSSESSDEVILSMRIVNVVIKQGKPLQIVITRNDKTDKPTISFLNVTGKRSAPMNAELSEMIRKKI
jgi:hypothetical protein